MIVPGKFIPKDQIAIFFPKPKFEYAKFGNISTNIANQRLLCAS